MLQQLQLEDVLGRRAGDVAELREFFLKAGIAVDTPRALHAVIALVRADRGFHRDLTSHVWVLLDRAGRQAAYPDLLAVVALAAAGAEFAPTAAETDAHDLLRFLMEAIRSLDAEQEGEGVVALSADVPAAPVPEANLETRLPERAVVPHSGQSRPRTAWVVAAVCLVAAITLAVLLFRQSGRRAVPEIVLAPMPGAATTTGDVAVNDPAGLPSADERDRRAGNVAAGAPVRKKSKPWSVPERVHAAPIFRVSPVSPGHPAVVTRVAPGPGSPVPATGTASSDAPMASARAVAPGATGFKIVPADVLSRRIGARGVPSYVEEDARNDAAGRRVPRLLRRQASAGWQAGNEPALVAEMQPPARPGTIRGASSAGVVRSESLGIMAGNVLYSPSPAYPSAASAAHVQGEVRLQAEVDRDGNVTDARVVSGHPLLREAALAAVQHWRFRPWLAHGKPVPMTAAALLEFELP